MNRNVLELAESFEQAEIVEIHSGDREPGRRLTEQGKQWVVAGLKLLAKERAS